MVIPIHHTVMSSSMVSLASFGIVFSTHQSLGVDIRTARSRTRNSAPVPTIPEGKDPPPQTKYYYPPGAQPPNPCPRSSRNRDRIQSTLLQKPECHLVAVTIYPDERQRLRHPRALPLSRSIHAPNRHMVTQMHGPSLHLKPSRLYRCPRPCRRFHLHLQSDASQGPTPGVPLAPSTSRSRKPESRGYEGGPTGSVPHNWTGDPSVNSSDERNLPNVSL